MLNDIKIKNTDELEFAVFCIENIAMRLKKWYRALTEKSDILNSYVIPEYEMFYPQLGVKLCSMAGGGVQKSIWCFLENRPGGTGQAVTCSTSGMGLRLK